MKKVWIDVKKEPLPHRKVIKVMTVNPYRIIEGEVVRFKDMPILFKFYSI